MRDAKTFSRRQVLAAASVTAGATAARAGHAQTAPRDVAQPAGNRDVRLPESDHIRTYYALARR